MKNKCIFKWENRHHFQLRAAVISYRAIFCFEWIPVCLSPWKEDNFPVINIRQCFLGAVPTDLLAGSLLVTPAITFINLRERDWRHDSRVEKNPRAGVPANRSLTPGFM